MNSHEQFELTAADGQRLFAQSWLPAEPKAIVALAHGLGEHGGRYDKFAARANGQGVGVIAVDFRGHGRSQGEAMLVNRFSDYLADLDALMMTARSIARGCPLFLMGHSMGGAVAVRWLAERGESIDGLVLSSAALMIGKDAPAFLLMLAPLISKIAPRLRVQALDARLISRDAAEVVRYCNDPLVSRLPPPARTAAELLATIKLNRAAAPRLRTPVYFFHGDGDRLTAPEGSREIYDLWGGDDRTLRIWPGSFHETINDLDGEAVMSDVIDWLVQHSSSGDKAEGASDV